jgi:AcrR family transcriptional regulator
MTRRDELLEGATDYVLANGLIGLSLRPMAERLGTSDRMLLYHFGSKDHLVAMLMRTSNDRSIAFIEALPPSNGMREAVRDLWAAVAAPALAACCRVYVEAAALGLLGREPYADVVGRANAQWTEALARHLVRSGVAAEDASRTVVLIDAAFMGFLLDLPLDHDPSERSTAVADLAEAVAATAPRPLKG